MDATLSDFMGSCWTLGDCVVEVVVTDLPVTHLSSDLDANDVLAAVLET